MAQNPFKRKVYDLLMPVEKDDFFIPVGEFQPSDCEDIVLKISRLRIKQISKLLEKTILFPENQQLIRDMQFHTYEDFILTRKHEAPQKGEYIPTGHSLHRHDTNLAGYLAYIRAHDADLAGFFFMRFQARIPENARKRHTYILGKTGSGKSELMKLFVYAYMRKPGYCTTAIIDPHGDMADEIARFKEHRDTDRLIYINPFLDVREKKTPTINPFDIKDKSRKNVDIVSQALVIAFKEILKNTTLTTQMEALLVPCITVLLYRPNSTLMDLQRFMNDDRNHDLVELGKQSKNPAHKSFFVHRFYERTFGITKASISTKLQSLFNSEAFYNMTVGESTLDIEEVLNSKKLVIFNLSKGAMGTDTSEAFGRFLIAMIQSAILKRAQIPKHKRIPVHLFVDEFQNYIAPSLEEVLSESRKYGLHLTLAQQYLGQRMDTAFKRGVLSNTQIKITGMASTDSRSAISKEVGVDESDISRLAVGQFYIKVGEKPAFRLYAPRFLLGNKNAMTWEDWHGVRLHQLNQYYRVLSHSKTDSDNMDKRGSDMSEYTDQPKTDETPQNKPKRVPKKPKFTFD